MGANLAEIAWPVHTARLALRPVADTDLPRLWSYRRLESVSRWVSRSINDYETFCAVYGSTRKMAETLVIELHGQVIGDLMIRVVDAWGQDEVAVNAQATQAELEIGRASCREREWIRVEDGVGKEDYVDRER